MSFSVQKSPSIEHEVTFSQTAVKRITSWKCCTNTGRTSLFCYPIKTKQWGICACQMLDTVARQFQKIVRSSQATNQKLPEITKQTRPKCEQCLDKSGKKKSETSVDWYILCIVFIQKIWIKQRLLCHKHTGTTNFFDLLLCSSTEELCFHNYRLLGQLPLAQDFVVALERLKSPLFVISLQAPTFRPVF